MDQRKFSVGEQKVSSVMAERVSQSNDDYDENSELNFSPNKA